MLVLGISNHEQICLGENIVLRFRRDDGRNMWRVLIEAPEEIQIHREEDDFGKLVSARKTTRYRKP